MTETYEEWRVTGQPDSYGGIEYPPYCFVWSKLQDPKVIDPERAARAFITRINERGGWQEGPYLHRRTVVRTEWELVDEDREPSLA